MKHRIITIAGRPASGKSTTSKKVAERLGFKRFSSGGMFRELAAKKDIDVLEANLTAEQDTEIDYLVDEKLRELGKTADKIVIDSRMAWHWIPQSFKVFLDLGLDVAAKRVLAESGGERRASEHIPTNPNEYAKVLQSRLDSEVRRYKKLYNVDPYDVSNYDLVIDTAKHNSNASAKQIIETFNHWLEN